VVPHHPKVTNHQLAPNPTIRPVRFSGISPGTTKTPVRPCKTLRPSALIST
jgi:hypothetical protein